MPARTVLTEQLRVPGPNPIPMRVLQAAARPMINHRSAAFTTLLRECVAGVQWALDTTHDVLLFPSSGTGGLEATIANLVSPGDTVLGCSAGWFGDLWADIAARYGAEVVPVRAPWGQSISPAALENALVAHPEAGIVLITHNETSTGVTNDLGLLAPIVKHHGRVLAVDAIGGAACLPLHVDELGLDVVVMGSQKGWLSPPGLAMIAVSGDAFDAASRAVAPRWYFDFHRQRDAERAGFTQSTPPLSVMYALAEGLTILQDEGRESVWARHARIATRLRAELERLGFDLFADAGCRSNSVTAVGSPFASAGELAAFVSELDRRQRLVVAEGHGQLRGRIFRIGHMGAIDERDVDDIVMRIDAVLRDFRGAEGAATAVSARAETTPPASRAA